MHFRHFFNAFNKLSVFKRPIFWFKTGPEFNFDIEKHKSNFEATIPRLISIRNHFQRPSVSGGFHEQGSPLPFWFTQEPF
jgi:hypothetical protein